MKTCIYLMTWLICHVTVLIAQPPSSSLDYLQNHKDLAIREMLRTGIPASIILSRALLESGAGQNDLARNANNHFGVQCGKSWIGSTHSQLTYNEEGALEPGCFRVYPNAAASFRDHSNLILAPDRIQRYRMLFKLATTDYYGWVNGLQLCGFIRSEAYAEKLITIIEDYGLHRYDAIFYMKTALPARYWSPTEKNENAPIALLARRSKPEEEAGTEYGFQYLESNPPTLHSDLVQRAQTGPAVPAPTLFHGQVYHYGGQLVAQAATGKPLYAQPAASWYLSKPDIGFDQDQFAEKSASSKAMLVHLGATTDPPAHLAFRTSLITKVFHKVNRNETLPGIARQYQTTVRQLIHLNGLRNTAVRQGMILQVS